MYGLFLAPFLNIFSCCLWTIFYYPPRIIFGYCQLNFWFRDALCDLDFRQECSLVPRVLAYNKMAVTASCDIIIKEKSLIWSILSDITISRRNASRERNERGFQLFMQNLKGVISLFLTPQDIAWTEELKEQTSWRLEDAYATLTLMENDISCSWRWWLVTRRSSSFVRLCPISTFLYHFLWK